MICFVEIVCRDKCAGRPNAQTISGEVGVEVFIYLQTQIAQIQLV